MMRKVGSLSRVVDWASAGPLLVAVLALEACSSAAAPTPKIIYVTPEPTAIPSPTPTPASHGISGSVHLEGLLQLHFAVNSATACTGNGGYADITTDSSVVVLNESGTVIATSALSPGALDGTGPTTTCRFSFVVTQVPDAAFYTIEISHRDGPTWSRAEMEAQQWTVDLLIGS